MLGQSFKTSAGKKGIHILANESYFRRCKHIDLQISIFIFFVYEGINRDISHGISSFVMTFFEEKCNE